ncbi:MAG: alpha-2-macroglobulin [Treponema sp.]|nr:alpha-2-macroglobulin [Treponema sp.]
MKKFITLLLSASFLTILACNEKSSSAPYSENQIMVEEVKSSDGEVSYSAGNFFTPDYRPMEAEPESVKGRLSLSAPKAKGGKVQSIVPGLRKLSDYLTSYKNKKEDFIIPEIKKSEESSPSREDDREFTVSDWGPKTEIPAQVRYPSFYVLFSKPVTSLASLNQQFDGSRYFTVSPAIKGTYRWQGSSLLTFDTEEAVNPLQVYTITLSDQVKSLSGQELKGEKVFKSQAAPLKIIWSAPGWSKNKWVDKNEVAPDFAKEFRVQFNYPVNAEEIKKLSTIRAGQEYIDFTIKQEMTDTVTYQWTKDIPFDTRVLLTLVQEIEDKKSVTEDFFHTLSSFTYEYNTTSSSYGKYTNPLYIYFSHPIDEKSVLSAISAVNEKNKNLPISKENIEVSGSTLKVFGLPLDFHSKYKLILSESLKDIYGRNLFIVKDNAISLEVQVPGAESRAYYTDSGVRLLESEFPHKMVFEYQNIKEGAYIIDKSENPFDVLKASAKEKVYSDKSREKQHLLDSQLKDQRIFEVVDFDDKLLNGRGWVEFYSAVKLPKKPSKWDPSDFYWTSNATSIQVTNLGVTVRYAMNKVVAMVTNLSDGKAVEGAKVYAYKDGENPNSIIRSAPSAITDKNGMALISLKGKTEFVISGGYWDPPYIYVEKDGDKVYFQPDDHAPWRSGVYSYEAVPKEIKSKPRVFLFSDRGLYKPGESISFRGIDRNQVLGAFIPYQGSYTITLSDDSWRDAKEYGKITGQSSESGGFYGSFTLPQDIEPGIYKILYKRDNERASQELRINVAYFERLKFQTSISLPSNDYITGEKIQAKIIASYLAGGALANATYQCNWFSEPWYFTSSEPALKNYTFGPKNTKEGRNHIYEDSGSLDVSGSSLISCQTGENPLKGTPYRYRVSADVTDLSNQQISTSSSAIVHPASFYIGLSKPEMKSSFAKKGEKITFDYKLALTDGKVFDDTSVLKSLAGKDKKISVKVTREEWNLVQQQGISDIYSRYEKTDVEESSQIISLDCNGKISITPQEPGYHKIQVASMDRQGRDVITEYEFFVTGSGRCSWYSDDATSIRLTPDKNQYNPGETAHILMESTLPEGNYLITVEREGIFTEEVRHLDGSIHVLDIPVARNYLPVFYVSVSSYSVRQGPAKNEYGSQDLDKPKGYYGAATLFVNPRVKSFSIKMESQKISYRPGEEAEITIYATRGGKALAGAEITLMAVDRGVLDLIDYHVPDPIAFFYNTDNFPLLVKGGDSRGYLMDPVTYEVKNLKGGDNGQDEKITERSDFNPTALFQPMLKTDENGKVTCKFKLPDTLTTYRLTAFGVKGELLSLQEDEIAVQNPINVEQVLPRQLRERDTSEMGLLLTNLDEKDHKVNVSVKITRASKDKAEKNGVTIKDGQAFIDGSDQHQLTLPSGTTGSVYFDIATKKAGIVSIEFTINSDILNEKLVCPLTIEKPYIFEWVSTTGQLTEKEDSVSEAVAIPSFAKDMNGSLSLTLDATRLGLLGDGVNYLFEYPYGCMEQQSSKILPLVIFEDYIDVFNMDSQVTNVRKLVKSYFKDWKNIQQKNGAFGYWPSSRTSDLFVSARIAHIYALAKERGYSESELGIDIKKLCTYIADENESLEKRADYIIRENDQTEIISLFYSDYSRAYNYYVLALNGINVPEEKLLKIINRENQDISALAFSGLAALVKDSSSPIAKTAAEKLKKFMKPTARGVDLTNPTAPKWAYAYYGDNGENLALALQLFTLIDKDDQINTRLLHSLLSNQRSGYWKNTATTARVLESIYTLIKANNLDKTDLRATAFFNKEELAQASFQGAGAKPVSVKVPFEDEKISKATKDSPLPLEISKKGKGSLYYTVSMKYALPQELQEAKDQGIGLTMEIFDNESGKEIKADPESNVLELESGKTYRVVMNVSSGYDRNFLALRAPIPSGGEILDATFVTSPDGASSASGMDLYSNDYDDYDGYYYGGDHYMSNQAIYNGEIQFFWDFFGKGKTTAEYKFRAVRRGVFPTPSASAQCMYEEEIFGRTGGILYTIK